MDLKKVFKWIKRGLLIAGGIAGAIFLAKATTTILKAVRGRVSRKDRFMPDPDDPYKIHVFPEGGGDPVPVDLSDIGVKSKQVKSAQLVEGGKPIVEVKHEKSTIRDALDPGFAPDPGEFVRGGPAREG